MILYLILVALDGILTFVVSLIPIFSTPSWIVTNLPEIFKTIIGFNNYLPVLETFTVVIFLLAFTLQYKVWKVVLSKAGVDMNA